MRNKIIQNNLISCVVAVVLTATICVFTYSHFIAQALILQAENQAYVLKEICESESDDVAALTAMDDSLKSRVTLISAQGSVIFDSTHEDILENHLDREEIAGATANGKGISERYSATDGVTNYYCALKLKDGGFIRVGVRSNQIFSDAVLANLPVIVVAVIAVLVMVYIVSVKTTRNIVKTIENFNFDRDTNQSYEELSPFIEKIKSQNETIQKQADKSAAEKDKLTAIFENMEESLVVCDRKKMVVQLNPQANRIFGLKKGDRLYEAIKDEGLFDNMETALSGKKVTGFVTRHKLTYQYTISPNIQNGINNGVIIIFLDITQQVESQRMRREFSANVTHELKTPLTSILGYSQLISGGIAKADDVAGFASIIEKNAEKLLTLIEDIMQISALEENGTGEYTFVDMKNLVREVADDLMPLAQEKDIRITTALEDVTIEANGKNMEDMVRNLVSNAIKYNRPQGTVEITLCRQDDKAVFRVKDTGIGIGAEHRQKIFQRFYVVDKSRNKNISSTGLGLSIVKHIVTAMNGTIELESAIGEGSQFTVTLPLKR
ncbi:MAG: PAS domain S-box protein [Oscillospiraceae bacterium]|nr:PAS domain S-box protein [Oscillospiraceae bacterium]